MPRPRMLVLAAFVALSVPALGAAAAVVVGAPTPEALVEGHTVFALIETSSEHDVDGRDEFAAAVAILVREQTGTRSRFAGVLWFNDQYLANPDSGGGDSYRYPCGGAVMAVNRGDPDPRMVLASAGARTQATPDPLTGPVHTGGNGTATDPATGASHGDDRAWAYAYVDTTGAPGAYADVHSDSLRSGNVMSYETSYSITDPNDHVWIVDKYRAQGRLGAGTGGASLFEPSYEHPVWVVNVMGQDRFVPDDGVASCNPFYDAALGPALDAVPSPETPGAVETPQPTPLPPPVPTRQPLPPQPEATRLNDGKCDGNDWPPVDLDAPARDDPCAGYEQPSRNGYCYGGQPAAAYGGDCTKAPLRLYNALLYFRLDEDLRIQGAPRSHAAGSTDTNGCSEGTEWACPGDESAEGNSHPFHPTPHSAHAGREAQPCLGSSATPGPGATNHGGSSGVDPADADAAGKYEATPCDLVHATRDIDVYYSPSGRPLPPPTRTFGKTDAAGSDAPFHDHNAAYGTSEP